MTVDRRLATVLERETGIEPATNSLEGCDSTTELLPHLIANCGVRSAEWIVRFVNPHSAIRIPQRRQLVAREGLEPSKPLGRQIYSLLRLTASLPRQLSVLWKRGARTYPMYADGAGEGI
jgi:hypothetical protein